MSKDSRRAIAAETVAIAERGQYAAPSGRTVSIAAQMERAIAGAVLHLPDEPLDGASSGQAHDTRIEVTEETSLAASRRLTAGGDVACLNFASAKNPGGGFLSGAHAQEEGLARSSGLYATLRKYQRDFYDFHRGQRDLLYSDRVIYSPGVPVFRDDSAALLEEPYEVAFLTSAAPNRGAIRAPEVAARVGATLRRRAARVLTVARHHGHRRLVLGAWGCGVFRNDPAEAAQAFRDLLRGGFAGVFEHVVFAVWDTAPGAPRHAAFVAALG